nr:unnamed protein product [Callosobruchus analis]
MAKFFVLLACVGLFQVAYGLQCYTCTGDNCESKSNMEHWQKPTCGKSNDPKMEPACMKHVYKDKAGKEMVERGCHLVPISGDFTCPRIGETTTVSCITCKADLCNSAQSVKFNIFAVVGVICSFFFTKLFM